MCFSFLKNASENKNDINNMKLNIPLTLRNSFICGTPQPSIYHLRSWQRYVLLHKEWTDNSNCIIISPNNSGKTLISEVAISQLLEKNKAAKIIFATSSSLKAEQKYLHIKSRFPDVKIKACYSYFGSLDTNSTIYISTYEKSNKLINTALNGNFIKEIKLLIVDDINLINDSAKGPELEVLITKVFTYSDSKIICFSSFLSNKDISTFEQWIGGITFNCLDYYPKITINLLKESGTLIRFIDQSLEMTKKKYSIIPDDYKMICSFVSESIEQQKSVVIYAHTDSEAAHISKSILSYLQSDEFQSQTQASQFTMEERRQISKRVSKDNRTSDLSNMVMYGIAYLSDFFDKETLHLIQEGFSDGIIYVIVSTYKLILTLKPEIIYLPSIYIDEPNKTPISQSEFTMLATRPCGAEPSLIIGYQDTNEELCLITELTKMQLGTVKAYLMQPEIFDKYFLQVLCFASDKPVKFTEFVRNTYYGVKTKMTYEEANEFINLSFERLRSRGLISSDKTITQLGHAISTTLLKIDEAISIYHTLLSANDGLCLRDPLHILYLFAPSNLNIKLPPISSPIFDEIFKKHSHVLIDKIGITRELLEQRRSEKSTQKTSLDQKFQRVIMAYLVEELQDGIPEGRVEFKYGISLKDIQYISKSMNRYATETVKLAEETGLNLLSKALEARRTLCGFNGKNEAKPLLEIPGCTWEIARKLLGHGVRNPSDIIKLSPADVAKYIHNEDGDSDEEFETSQRICASAKKFQNIGSLLDSIYE